METHSLFKPASEAVAIVVLSYMANRNISADSNPVSALPAIAPPESDTQESVPLGQVSRAIAWRSRQHLLTLKWLNLIRRICMFLREPLWHILGRLCP